MAANSSWLAVIPGASHSTFMDAGCLLNPGLDLVCGRGKLGRRDVADLTATPMLAWLYYQLQACCAYCGCCACCSAVPGGSVACDGSCASS